MCQGRAEITRPFKKIEGMHCVRRRSDYGHIIEDMVFSIVTIGGTDACPICAAKAELEWRIDHDI